MKIAWNWNLRMNYKTTWVVSGKSGMPDTCLRPTCRLSGLWSY